MRQRLCQSLTAAPLTLVSPHHRLSTDIDSYNSRTETQRCPGCSWVTNQCPAAGTRLADVPESVGNNWGDPTPARGFHTGAGSLSACFSYFID
ncbi:hypothetical protein BDZ45DRAFT_669030 [Acephala macrosclerotiorum]|nr:hypothetical protein BDZ45DRAFT_669030 [Acephala macrosclerotiorum]